MRASDAERRLGVFQSVTRMMTRHHLTRAAALAIALNLACSAMAF
jgi:hypothetical protein